MIFNDYNFGSLKNPNSYIFKFYHEKFPDQNNRRSTHCLVFRKNEWVEYTTLRAGFKHDKTLCNEAGLYVFKFENNGAFSPGSKAPLPVAHGIATCNLNEDNFLKVKGRIKSMGRAVAQLIAHEQVVSI